MPEKLIVKQAVIVEGKYDKIKLCSIIDGLIIATDGFRIYKNKEKAALIRAVAKKQGVIILTDSDTAGFQLRSFIKSIAGDAEITNIYVPQQKGKERRKAVPGKEGILGVEGIDSDIIRELFIKAAGFDESDKKNKRLIDKMDFYDDGLAGGENSQRLRKALAAKLNLPCYITANSLAEVINSLIDYDEYKRLVTGLKEE